MRLTDQAKQAYLDSGGIHCPYCGSEQTEGRAVEIDAGKARQPMACLACNREWTDVYTLQDVQEKEA